MAATTTTRVAFVTGAAQGIGEAIALRLAQDGLDVAILDIKGKEGLLQDVSAQILGLGRRSLWQTGDVSNEEEVRNAVQQVADTLGGIDVVVANAGFSLLKPFFETTTEEWHRLYSVNTLGIMFCYKYAAQQMIKQGHGGRLISACSGAGKQGNVNMVAYSASKFAVRGLTQALAQELRPHKITVNGYAPGLIFTPAVAHPDDDKHGGLGSVARMIAKMPEGVDGADPSVIAAFVSYLASLDAHFITGQTVNIDGGLHFD